MSDEYPANSKSPAPKRAPKEVKQVVKNGATVRKKGLGKRVSETFVGEDAKGVVNYVILDVMIPAVKDMIADSVSQGIERMLFGDRRRSSTPNRAGSAVGSYTTYNRPQQAQKQQRQELARSNRGEHSFEDIIIDDRSEAQDVRDQMLDLLGQYQQVSVSDFKEMVGVKPNFVDERWGWTDLDTLAVHRARGGGYYFELPKPISIN